MYRVFITSVGLIMATSGCIASASSMITLPEPGTDETSSILYRGTAPAPSDPSDNAATPAVSKQTHTLPAWMSEALPTIIRGIDTDIKSAETNTVSPSPASEDTPKNTSGTFTSPPPLDSQAR